MQRVTQPRAAQGGTTVQEFDVAACLVWEILDGFAFQILMVISAFTSQSWHPDTQAGKLPGLSVQCLLCSGVHSFPLVKQVFPPRAKPPGPTPPQQTLPWVHGHSNVVGVHSVRGMVCIISKPSAGTSVKHSFMISQAAR